MTQDTDKKTTYKGTLLLWPDRDPHGELFLKSMGVKMDGGHRRYGEDVIEFHVEMSENVFNNLQIYHGRFVWNLHKEI
jgi:hypothetical protein